MAIHQAPPISETVAARVTPPGRGAVATIRLRGRLELVDAEPALFRAANGLPLHQQPLGRICFGRWGTEPGEEVVVCRTGRHEAEIHCHGGEAAPARVLEDLQRRGGSICSWLELLGMEADPFTAECQEAVTKATTLRTAAILLEQASGRLRSAFERLLALTATDALAPTAGDTSPQWPEGRRRQVLCRLESVLRWADFGCHLTAPWSVVLAGRPNVGKSSLINALLGYTRAIVSDQPGTTRDVVSAETAFDGWPVRLSDTAGFRDLTNATGSAATLERDGIHRAREQLRRADCRVLLVDVSRPATEADRQLLRSWPDAIVVAHKSDRPIRWNEPFPEGTLFVSARTGAGLPALIEAITRRLVPERPPAGAALPVTARQVDCLRRAEQAARDGDRERCRRYLEACLNPPRPESAIGVAIIP
ncbi:MAG TPA: GTP-binding protein [Planctomycetaceae bacterium]|nr:GTP-binding protein [Planctomycetaceae bacterium]